MASHPHTYDTIRIYETMMSNAEKATRDARVAAAEARIAAVEARMASRQAQLPPRKNVRDDPIVNSVIMKFLERSQLTHISADTPTDEWITHIQNELMNSILYLETLKQPIV